MGMMYKDGEVKKRPGVYQKVSNRSGTAKGTSRKSQNEAEGEQDFAPVLGRAVLGRMRL